MRTFVYLIICLTISINFISCCDEPDPNNNFSFTIIDEQTRESLITLQNWDSVKIIETESGEEPELTFYEGVDYNFIVMTWFGDYELHQEKNKIYSIEFQNQANQIRYNFELEDDEGCGLFDYKYVDIFINDTLISTDNSRRLAIIER